jgi:hypothetical protein
VRLVHIISAIGAGASVTQDQIVGTIAPPGEKLNGGTAHLHIEAYTGGDCFDPNLNQTFPFAASHGSSLSGINLPDTGARNVPGGQHKGAALSRQSTGSETEMDFNGDGKDDAITFNQAGQGVVALSGGSSFGAAGIWGNVFTWGEIPAVGDFNGDGKDDVITFNQAGQGVVIPSTGSSFGTAGIWGNVFTWGEIPAVGDFNGDGKDDAITFNQAGQGVVTLSSGSSFGAAGIWGNVFTWGEIPGGFGSFAWHKLFRDTDFDQKCNPGVSGPICGGVDNCPTSYNPAQENFDSDPWGDLCESDDDNDGFEDGSEALITTGSLDACGLDGWPSNLDDSGASANKLDIADIVSFLAPAPRRLDSSPPGPPYNPRWDLVPGPGIFSNHINIADMVALLAGPTGNPPMFGGARAFGKTCPFPP